MARVKIDYGIDLGTTNSAISRMDNGTISIIKSDRFQMDTTPSCVRFTKKKMIIGYAAYNAYSEAQIKAFTNPGQKSPSSFIEFKRTMGTDKKYESVLTGQMFSSEELSSEILKYLKSYIKDENINAAVITVPNQFRQNQVDATQRAAKLAGFKYCELLQEPIAASMAYGVDADNIEGYWLVFDFGGGTFDAALMKVDEGIMKVVDTGGSNHLGGKDLDLAIVESILIPYLKENYEIDNILANPTDNVVLRDCLKVFAEEIKIALSSNSEFEFEPEEPIGEDDNGKEMEFKLEISLSDYEQAVSNVFQKSIDITLELLSENNLTGSNLSSLLLVGGPTFSQTLRRMLKDQITTAIDTSVDPMTSVAKGAALFASTKEIPLDLQERDTSKIQLTLKYPETTVETEEHLGIRVERTQCSGDVPQTLFLEISRSDLGWASGKIQIEDAEITTLQLLTGRTNSFDVTIFDEQGNTLLCEPSQFTIIQGLKVATPTLPKSFCIDSIDSDTGKQILSVLSGLEKNQSLPARGKGKFKTQKEIRPGKSEDILRIPIFEGENGERALYNQEAGYVFISGEDFSEYLPEGSEVEITLTVDSSRRGVLEAYFEYCDETIERVLEEHTDTLQSEVSADILNSDINKAKHNLALIGTIESSSLTKELNKLSLQLQNIGSDYDAKLKILEDLRTISKKIDKLEAECEWPEAEKKLDANLSRLQTTNERYGNTKTSEMLSQFKSQVQQVKQQQNVKLANDLAEEIFSLDFNLIRQDVGLWVSYIKGYDDDFESQEWTDRNTARQLINEAKQVIATQPSREKIESIVFQLFALLPDKDMPLVSETDQELLAR